MRPAVLTVAAIALLIFPTARAGDVDDLKATVLKELKAYGERDCKTVIGLRTDPTVAYSPNNPEPVEWGKAESLKRCADGPFDNWADLPEAKAVFTPVDYQYRVMGATGLVYGRLNQDFHFGPGTVTVYTRAAPNTTSFRAEPCTSPPAAGPKARPSAHRR